MIWILRFLSVAAFTLAQTILYDRLFTLRLPKWQSRAVTVLYCFWMNFCNEFLFSNGYVALIQLVITLAFLQVQFQGDFMQKFILRGFLILVEAAVSLLFGGAVGTMYRFIVKSDEPLWISGENLALTGLFFSLICLGLWVIVCLGLMPHFAEKLRWWRKSAVRFLFGVCTALEIVNLCVTFSFSRFDGLSAYLFVYGILLAVIALSSFAAIIHMIKSLRKSHAENQMLEAKMRKQYIEYQMVTLLQQEIREIHHDLKNHLAASGGGVYQKTILNFCDEIQKELEELQ